jgi:hypothetical protein
MPPPREELDMQRRFAITLIGMIACASCSQRQEQGVTPSPALTTAPATSVPMLSGAQVAAGVGVNGSAPYFYDLLQRPDFASAWAALSGADQLPTWTGQGGTSTPAQRIDFSGRPQLLVATCQPHDCLSERLLVLYDENTHAMSGLFARRKAGAANDVDSNDPIDDDVIWLGSPDDATKRFLRQKLYAPE